MQIGENVKNLVIQIPNEWLHGPGEDNEARFIDQSFVPEIAVVTLGTNVFWFNGDAGHEHDIICRPPYMEKTNHPHLIFSHHTYL